MRMPLTLAGASLLAAAIAVDATSAQEPPGCEPAAGRAAVYGVVRDSATGLPLQRLEVQASWQDGSRRRSAKVDTDVGGAYRLCDVLPGIGVTVEASRGGRASELLLLAAGERHRMDMRIAAPRSTVSGRVVEHGSTRGIADAEVRVVGGRELRAITREDGGFRLPDLPGGTFGLEIGHIAYESRRDSLVVQSSAAMVLTIQLSQQVIALRPIEVEVRSHRLQSAGFYARRDRGFGTYATRHEWERRMPRYPSDIARTMAGVRVVPRRYGMGYVLLDRSNCAFRYVLDGARVGPSFQMDDIPVDWIEAVEVYRGAATVPPEFVFPTVQERANCGVIVIWTRGAR
jgi:hypothetical protein